MVWLSAVFPSHCVFLWRHICQRSFDLLRTICLPLLIDICFHDCLQRSTQRHHGVPDSQPDAPRMLREEVTAEDVSEIVSRWTGIPVQVRISS